MNRRRFFGAAAVAVIAPNALAISPGRRVSIVKGDPGERLYGCICADGGRVRVLLDGIEQPRALTADESLGFVDRLITSPGGNVAFNRATGELLEERVYGQVKIEVV